MSAGAWPRARGDAGPARRAVILARGLGTRMRRTNGAAVLDPRQSKVADTGVKALIPVGRPFLDYVLSALADSGCEQACLVIGPEHQAVRDYYTLAAPPRRILLSFAIQAEPLGTADAVLSAEEFVAGEDFLVINSDNYYPASVLRALRTLGEPGVALFEREALARDGNIPPERIRAFAIGTADRDGYLERIIEKPDDATLTSLGPDALVSMNSWRFSPAIFPACRGIRPSARGELELPGAVREAMAAFGARFKVVRCRGGVLDLSSRSDIASIAGKLRGMRADP